MPWSTARTKHFTGWWELLTDEEQDEIDAAVELLEERGPALGRPLVDHVKQSRYPNMKELRLGTTRILFAFDPKRTGILLLGGDKRGNWDGWYDTYVPIADQLYDAHLKSAERRE